MTDTQTDTDGSDADRLVAALGLVAAACGSDDGDGAADDAAAATDGTGAPDRQRRRRRRAGTPSTIDWWHIQNNDPGKADWQAMADAYTAEHPNVTINITVMENEAFKAALQTNMQAGDVPDLFQSWGGGGLRDQVDAGLVQDITDASSGFIGDLSAGAAGLYQVDGKQYGVPVQRRHGRLLVQQGPLRPGRHRRARRRRGTSCSTDVQTLKDAGITPIAVGAGDKWPAHFWYSYLMVRLGGADAMNADRRRQQLHRARRDRGRREGRSELVALEPFQDGFLGAGWDAPDGESGTMASGRARRWT